MDRKTGKRVAVVAALAASLTLLMGADGCEFKCEADDEAKVSARTVATEVAAAPATLTGEHV
jgi:hypothetical protein